MHIKTSAIIHRGTVATKLYVASEDTPGVVSRQTSGPGCIPIEESASYRRDRQLYQHSQCDQNVRVSISGLPPRVHLHDLLEEQALNLKRIYKHSVAVIRDTPSKTTEELERLHAKRQNHKYSLLLNQHYAEMRIKQMSQAYSLPIPPPRPLKRHDPVWLKLMRKDTADYMHSVQHVLESIGCVTKPSAKLFRTTKLAVWRARYYRDLVNDQLEPEPKIDNIGCCQLNRSYNGFNQGITNQTGSTRRKLVESQERLRNDLKLRFNGTKPEQNSNRFAIRAWYAVAKYVNRKKITVGTVVRNIAVMNKWLNRVNEKRKMKPLRTVQMLRNEYKKTTDQFHGTLKDFVSKYSPLLIANNSEGNTLWKRALSRVTTNIKPVPSKEDTIGIAWYLLSKATVRERILADQLEKDKKEKEDSGANMESSEKDSRYEQENKSGIDSLASAVDTRRNSQAGRKNSTCVSEQDMLQILPIFPSRSIMKSQIKCSETIHEEHDSKREYKDQDEKCRSINHICKRNQNGSYRRDSRPRELGAQVSPTNGSYRRESRPRELGAQVSPTKEHGSYRRESRPRELGAQVSPTKEHGSYRRESRPRELGAQVSPTKEHGLTIKIAKVPRYEDDGDE